MSITVNCVIDLTEEELLFVLRRRAGQIIMVSPPEETTTAASVGPILTPEQIADIAREEAEQAMARTVIDMEEAAAAKGNETPASVSIPAGDGDYPVTEGIPPPRLPKVPRRAKANGAETSINSTPIASPLVNRLDEASMRALLSKVGAVHPLKVKAITNILEEVGGRRRLSECDPATWPAIAEAAQKILAEYAP
jgi:hypothetical protein